MKKTLLYFIFFIFIFSACKKSGEIIQYPSFGKLFITGTASSPLLIQIDGKIVDTLSSASGSSLTFPVAEGDHKISLLDSVKKSIVDTLLNFKKGETTSLSNFFYSGYGILFPDADTSRKPSAGKMLMRFVITDKNLPDELNLELFISDPNTGLVTPANVKINNVRKDKFNNYIELDNPGPDGATYLIEGYDLKGNKPMSIDDGSYGYISINTPDMGGVQFVPNGIISLGIDPANPDLGPYHPPVTIFYRVAK